MVQELGVWVGCVTKAQTKISELCFCRLLRRKGFEHGNVFD